MIAGVAHGGVEGRGAWTADSDKFRRILRGITVTAVDGLR